MKGYADCDLCEGEGTILAVPPGLGEQEEVDCPDCDLRAAAEAEQAFERRAAFGPGVDVVNILTGQRYRT